ncbi:MAG: glycoside hydrolase family 9 protein [Lachnospiraceae bacterium]|nr:glycoside hydrolase family 9 protein [Lachnospiraceae bacterium]
MKKIHINQLGYRPADTKKATITINASRFSVIRASDRKIVFRDYTGAAFDDAASGDTVKIADFSYLSEKGTYFITAKEEGSTLEESYPFVITDDPYKEMRKALLDFFHYQKCGVDLECGKWSHPACHTQFATIYGTGEKKDVSGGWHDAGDYGRYIVPAAMTIADLLLAYELAPNPDEGLLDIVWFEIEWMLKMQDESNGGVYHKVTCKNFNAFDEMPEDELEELFILPVSLAATADFAASIALASRFYPEKKEMLINAAKHAFEWCLENPDEPSFKNPPDIKTGPYGNWLGIDEYYENKRFWAACELFVATGEEKYHSYIKGSDLFTGLGWQNVGAYGLYAYITQAGERADEMQIRRMKECFQAACFEIINNYKTDGYGVSLGTTYRWGSNIDVGNNAMMLILGSLIFTEKALEYKEIALDHIHYLLGRNALSQSYITGYGHQPAKNPHHRPSISKGEAVPGMVVGGPCMNTDADEDLMAACTGMPPAKCYIDHAGSYASNEITIYWNSPAYFVVAVLDL